MSIQYITGYGGRQEQRGKNPTTHRARKRKGTGKKAKLESTKEDNRNKPNIFLTININGLNHQFKVKL